MFNLLLKKTKAQPEPRANIVEVLPPELLLEIFSHLRSMEELCTVSQVCRLFAAVSREDLLWKPLGCPSWQEDEEATERGGQTSEVASWKLRYMTWLRHTLEVWLARRPIFERPTPRKTPLLLEEDEEEAGKHEPPPKRLELCFSLIGSVGAGKTSFLQRFADVDWRDHGRYPMDFSCRTMRIMDGLTAKFIGVERFNALPNWLLLNKHGVAFCYDSTDLTSFLELTEWLERLNDVVKDKGAKFNPLVRLLVGLKCDQVACQVSNAMAEEMAAKLNAFAHIRASSKTGVNVEYAIRLLAKATLDPFSGLSPCHRPAYIPETSSLLRRGRLGACLLPPKDCVAPSSPSACLCQ
ncbi:Ras-related protein Rab-27A [Balamuthia mandrillaris]